MASPPDIAVIGPLARSADDLETALRLMAGPDALDAPLRADLPTLTEPLPALRIAVWSSDPFCPPSAAVAARLQAVVDALAQAGAHIDPCARPGFDPAQGHRVYSALLAVAMSGGLDDAAFAQAQARAAALAADDDSDRARQLRWQTMPARRWHHLNEARHRIRLAWHAFFQTHDLLLTPIMPTPAFAHDHRPFGQRTLAIDGVDTPYFHQTFWAGLAALAQLPATVIPAGCADDGLPVGVQIIGPAWGDLRTIGLAQRLQGMGFGFRVPPAAA